MKPGCMFCFWHSSTREIEQKHKRVLLGSGGRHCTIGALAPLHAAIDFFDRSQQCFVILVFLLFLSVIHLVYSGTWCKSLLKVFGDPNQALFIICCLKNEARRSHHSQQHRKHGSVLIITFLDNSGLFLKIHWFTASFSTSRVISVQRNVPNKSRLGSIVALKVTLR